MTRISDEFGSGCSPALKLLTGERCELGMGLTLLKTPVPKQRDESFPRESEIVTGRKTPEQCFLILRLKPPFFFFTECVLPQGPEFP